MIESRLWAKTTSEETTSTPVSSGPRWCSLSSAAAIASRWAAALPASLLNTTTPHMATPFHGVASNAVGGEPGGGAVGGSRRGSRRRPVSHGGRGSHGQGRRRSSSRDRAGDRVERLDRVDRGVGPPLERRLSREAQGVHAY